MSMAEPVTPELVDRAVQVETGELVPLPPADSLDQYADPGAFITLACERSKAWLVAAIERGDIDTIVETKAHAEAIRVYTVQKQLGHDTELAAQEIVRRAERGIGVCIRNGQEEGAIRTPGDSDGFHGNQHTGGGLDPQGTKASPADFATKGELTGKGRGDGIYAMTDGVSDEHFEEAVTEAKDEGNLSRANVARKAKEKAGTADGAMSDARWLRAKRLASEGYTSDQVAAEYGIKPDNFRVQARRRGVEFPADNVTRKTRRIDHNRVVESAVTGVNGEVAALRTIGVDFTALDPAAIDGWVSSLSESIRFLNRFKNQLKKETQP